ncbi:MAG TPA: flippase [Lacunisphaera sp.]|jgi:O-antigen/teichoic acid export membrane protein
MNISELLPAVLRHRLSGRHTVYKAMDNAAWLTVDQVVRMAASLTVGVWAARYLGPEQYGWLSYATAVVGTVAAFTSLGLNGVVVRELVRAPGEAHICLGAAFFIKTVGAVVGFVVCCGVAWLQPMAAPMVRPLIVILSFGSLLQILDVIDLVFQARSASRISALVRISACVAASLLKVALILAHVSLRVFTIAIITEVFFSGMGWLWIAQRADVGLSELRVKMAYVKRLLTESWPLALSSIAIYIQAYADQLVIGQKLGGSDLGQYAVAMRLITSFSFVPMVICTVAAPEITRAKHEAPQLYHRRLYDLYRLMGVLFLIVAGPIILFGGYGVKLIFGPAYAGAALLLPWLGFRLLFTNFGVARSIYLTNEGLFSHGLVTALIGAGVNVALNLWWIPRWGSRGAIAASLVSFAITTFACEAFQAKARTNLRLMLTAALLPWRRFAG